MKKRKHKWSEESLVKTSSAVFMETYNKNLPASFPRVSIRALEKFQETNSSLFKDGHALWSMDKHRKRLMNWLSSQERQV
ncbi:MAG: hypothetical protein Q7R73_04380 [bacterium]|nr:hypothetical protein [bacterium]